MRIAKKEKKNYLYGGIALVVGGMDELCEGVRQIQKEMNKE